jgi:hypothetical protein
MVNMQEIYNKLLKHNITPNQLYYLHCLRHKTVPAKFINITLEYDRLKNDNWVHDNKITAKGIALLDSLDTYFKKSKVKSNQVIMGEDFYEKIAEYRELFPNIKLPSGKPARTNVKTLEALFRWFFTEFQYEWETIFGATKMYLDQYERDNWKYMRTSQYFVRKQNPDKTFDSDLANYCDMYLNGLNDEDQHFKEKVV